MACSAPRTQAPFQERKGVDLERWKEIAFGEQGE
jgi:hypothetical protein